MVKYDWLFWVWSKCHLSKKWLITGKKCLLAFKIHWTTSKKFRAKKQSNFLKMDVLLIHFFWTLKMVQEITIQKQYLLDHIEIFCTGVKKGWKGEKSTMRTNLPKTLDQLIFSKCSQNQLNISKVLPPKRCKTLRSY